MRSILRPRCLGPAMTLVDDLKNWIRNASLSGEAEVVQAAQGVSSLTIKTGNPDEIFS